MKRACAYCGESVTARHKGHVVSNCLYPSSTPTEVQRPTVPECENCRALWTEPETQFRNILVIAGEQNRATEETWETIQRSFTKPSGKKWVDDIYESMSPVATKSGQRYMVYPHKDLRVNLVLRKIVRGLSAYHGVGEFIPDDHVWVGCAPAAIPDESLPYNLGKEFMRYGYALFDAEIELCSGWLFRFYDSRDFLGIVAKSTEEKLAFASIFNPPS